MPESNSEKLIKQHAEGVKRWRNELDNSPRACRWCKNYGFCMASCSLAPWNFSIDSDDRYIELPNTTPLGHLLRKRRWIGYDLRIWHIYGEKY